MPEQIGIVVKAGEELNTETGKTNFKLGVDQNLYTLFEEKHMAVAKENLGKGIKVTYEMKGRFRNVESIEPAVGAVDTGDNRERLIVRQACLKAAATASMARGSIETEEVIEIARRFEAFVYEKTISVAKTAVEKVIVGEDKEEPPDLWDEGESGDFPPDEEQEVKPATLPSQTGGTPSNLATAAQIKEIDRLLKAKGMDRYDASFVARLKARFDLEDSHLLLKHQASEIISAFKAEK